MSDDMPSAGGHRTLRAGQALRKLFESDPEARAEWDRRNRELAERLRPRFEAIADQIPRDDIESLGMRQADAISAAVAGTEVPAASGFACSKTELLLALGKDKTNTKYLRQLVDAERLVMKGADKPIGHARYVVRFTDPEEHARVIDAIKRNHTAP